MALVLKDGSEFLHVPKTGGTWVTKVLTDLGVVSFEKGPQHADFTYNLINPVFTGSGHLKRSLKMAFIKLLGMNKFESSKTIRFCFVRNPLSWYESFWKYMNSKNWNGWGENNSAIKWNPVSPLYDLAHGDFNEFIRNVMEARPGFVTELFYSFTKSGISFIGRTENLEKDLIFILERLGFDFDQNFVRQYKSQNVSKKPDLDMVWDPDLRRRILLMELPALVHFGYLTREDSLELKLTKSYSPNPSLIIR